MALSQATQPLRSRSTQAIARCTPFTSSCFLHLVRPGQRASSSSTSAALGNEQVVHNGKSAGISSGAGEQDARPVSATGRRLTKAQQQMLANAALLARAIDSGSSSTATVDGPLTADVPTGEKTVDVTSPLPSPTGDRTTDFLALITASTAPPPQPNISPDLRTLLTCRPTRAPRPHHRQYEWDYNGHFEKLNRAFLREQLVSMYEELRIEEAKVLSGMNADFVAGQETTGLPILKRSAKKKEIIESILREWGWPTMKEVRKEKKIREENKRTVNKPFPLSPAEHYFLRREPGFIRDLAARNMLHLTMDRVPPSEVSSTSSDSVPSPTQTSDQTYETRLVIKGRAFDVEQFEAAVKRKFSKLNEQTLAGEVFGPGLEQLYETVSVMSNAFVERTEGGNIKISCVNTADRDRAVELLRAAKRLLATTEPTSRAEIVALRPSSLDQSHAMYPYLPPTAYVPSALSASSIVAKTEVGSDWFLAGQSWFRIRQVGGWFQKPSKETTSDGIVTMSGKVDAETLEAFGRGDQPDWVKLVSTVEYGQLIFSSGDAGNTTWTPPIAGEKTLQELREEIGATSLSTVFLPGSVSPLHEVDAIARPPSKRIRLRYEEKAGQSENDWKPFLEVEVESLESSAAGATGEGQEVTIRGSTGREQVQYCLRPASDTDMRIRRRFDKVLSLQELPDVVRGFLKTASFSPANASSVIPPQEVTFDGKTFHLRSATHIDAYQDLDGTERQVPLFENPTDFSTGIKGSRMEEKIVGVQIADLHKHI